MKEDILKELTNVLDLISAAEQHLKLLPDPTGKIKVSLSCLDGAYNATKKAEASADKLH